MIKVSFIIPVYNAVRYLPKLVESLQSQDNLEWEAVFTDDGSTDGSLIFLQKASANDSRIKVFQIAHEGSSGARNKGLDVATGDIIGFIDADDYIHPQLISTAKKFFDDEDVDLVVWDYTSVEDGKHYEFKKIDSPPQYQIFTNPFLWALTPWNPTAHAVWRSFYRKDVIGDVRFFPRIKHQDLLFSYEVWGSIKKMVKLNVSLYAYVQSPNSVIRSVYTVDKMMANFVIISELNKKYSKHGCDRILSLLKKRLFPQRLKDVWKQIDKIEDASGEMHSIMNLLVFDIFKRKIVGFSGFSLTKKIRFFSILYKGWRICGGMDVRGRVKRFFLKIKLHCRRSQNRLSELYWRKSVMTEERPVSVIIPVYNGYDALIRLSETLFAHTDKMHRIIFINDASSDARIDPLLFRLANENTNVCVIKNDENKGFAESVNKAVALTEGDFVLLNTDTEVPLDWIPRLFSPIWRDKTTASVTPLTCESHLLGVPTPNAGTISFVEKYGVRGIDRAVSRIIPDLEKDILVEGIGFCLAISRTAWNKVGPFAADVFGRGYGEESDWCLRAHYKYGYSNRYASNLFVAHWHNGSFTKQETSTLKAINSILLKVRNPRFGNDCYLQALSKAGRREVWRLASIACAESGFVDSFVRSEA